MNQVDIYIGNYRLDLFKDEEISINLNVQDVADISKVFADYTQSFTIPASEFNNAVFGYWWRLDVDDPYIRQATFTNGTTIFKNYQGRVLVDGGTCESGDCLADVIDALGGSYSVTYTQNTYDWRERIPSRIEINSLLFRYGSVELEQVEMKDGDPYAYTLTFYGNVVNMSDLFGEDFLYNLDFSAYDHAYTSGNIVTGMTGTGLFSGNIMYPLMSPVKNWIYDSGSGSGSHSENNIAFHTSGGGHGAAHGINYYELKPGIKVARILDAIEVKYGIQFVSDYLLGEAQFTQLYLWLHRKEGYMYFNQPNAMSYQDVPFDVYSGDWGATGFVAPADDYYLFEISTTTQSDSANFAVFVNNGYVTSGVLTAVGIIDLGPVWMSAGQTATIKVKSQDNSAALSYRINPIGVYSWTTATLLGDAYQVFSRTISVTIRVTELMPEMKVKDFMTALIKMFNLVIIPTGENEYALEPKYEWLYGYGSDKDWTAYTDVSSHLNLRMPIYREISYEYQPAGDVLGFEYARTNEVGYGDLRAEFPQFFGDEYITKGLTENPLFSRLTDERDGTITKVLVFKSIKQSAGSNGQLSPYLGKPVFYYAKSGFSISPAVISFVNESLVQTGYSNLWYSNTSNEFSSPESAYSTNFGGDVDPYHLVAIPRSLYATYHEPYIVQLYDRKTKLVQYNIKLPLLQLISLNLADTIVIGNSKYWINTLNVNLTTGRGVVQLIPQLGLAEQPEPSVEIPDLPPLPEPIGEETPEEPA